jgi:hypothetical protein
MCATAAVFNVQRQTRSLLCGVDTGALFPFAARVVKILPAVFCLALAGCASSQPKLYQVQTPKPLPIALDRDFAFHKTKPYFLDDKPKPIVGLVDASIAFERSYRLQGAITALDQHQLFGDYFDFFWLARRQADVRVRLEYRQEKLHAFVQAREVRYPNAKGHHETEFAIIGDDYFDGGRVLAWRASLIVNGRMAAVTRSYLWE